MAYRWRPKNAVLDPDSPQAWGQCDRCGMVWRLVELQWQYGYQGTTTPQNTRLLVCPKHLDPLNPQDAAYVLPPDPMPVFNARPGAVDLYGESSFLITQDGEIITTQDDVDLVTAIPNPSTAANTTNLVCSMIAPGADLSVAYLDLFDGNPSSGGRSVLADITGSTTRTDIAAYLTTISGVAKNAAALLVAAASGSQTNISWVGLYSSSISGALLASGECSASPTIALGNPVQFPPVGLSVNLN